MFKLIRGVLPAALLGLAAISSAQQSWVGPELGVYLPTSGKLRDALGDRWVSFGAGFLRQQEQPSRRMSWDWEAVSQSKNGSKVFMAAVSYGYNIPFGSQGQLPNMIQTERATFQPYAALRAGGSYIDFAVNTDGKRESGKRVGLNANAELGVLVGDRLKLSARYDFFPTHNGLDFSGVTLSVRYGLFRF
jgi:hypothetical protein